MADVTPDPPVPVPWEEERAQRAGQLYAALVAVVGEPWAWRYTGVNRSWQLATGVQGYWRADHGGFWLGRLVTDPSGVGRTSTLLGLSLTQGPEPAAAPCLAHPTVYHARAGEGTVTSYAPDTPEIYAAALTLLTALATDVALMVPPSSKEVPYGAL